MRIPEEQDRVDRRALTALGLLSAAYGVGLLLAAAALGTMTSTADLQRAAVLATLLLAVVAVTAAAGCLYARLSWLRPRRPDRLTVIVLALTVVAWVLGSAVLFLTGGGAPALVAAGLCLAGYWPVPLAGLVAHRARTWTGAARRGERTTS